MMFETDMANLSKKPRSGNYHFEFLYRPGRSYSGGQVLRLSDALRDVANECFAEIPHYQCLTGTREDLSDKVIALAWRPDGKLAGFCSSLLIDVPGVGEVFHLGLTCVRPGERSAGLTHRLNSRATIGYLLRYRPLSKMWVSNVACVLSSLGNVALHFEQVYPSPTYEGYPSEAHLRIADTINESCRDKIYIRSDSEFDRRQFVFRGSVLETGFQKAQNDARFHHRQANLNDYYSSLMSWEAGDEVLQIGYCTVLTGLKYGLSKLARKGVARPASRTLEIPPAGEPEAA